MGMDEDRARFEGLFGEHYAAVARYAARRVGVEHADDIVGEAFLVAWRRLHDVPRDNPLPWLYATARHLIANELRGRRRRARLDARLGAEIEDIQPDPADSVTDRVRVRVALAQLPAVDQEVLRLAEWECLDAADAATVLGCSRAAYKVRLHRARKRLARQLCAVEQKAGQAAGNGGDKGAAERADGRAEEWTEKTAGKGNLLLDGGEL
jgi:RNA polymerase sigma-70 factor (ECF subfamily)